ncbi:hypothetical protein [Streptomyces sp. NPDC046942]|uniref:hypothetical protein n=1 Tax=Streptomyces sp. NPDC046942 TaxID=3155137 RepID=UPI003410CFB7
MPCFGYEPDQNTCDVGAYARPAIRTTAGWRNLNESGTLRTLQYDSVGAGKMTDGSGDQLVKPADGCDSVGEHVGLALRHGRRRHLDADAVTRRGPRTDQDPGASASAAGRAEHCRRIADGT